MNKITLIIVLLTLSNASAANFQPSQTNQIVLKDSTGEILLSSPAEGLWSVALNWENDWPSDWKHVQPTSVSRVNDVTVLEGALELDRGTLEFRDLVTKEQGGLRIQRRYEWHGETVLEKVTFAIRFQTPGVGNSIVMPGLMYHGNPNGKNSGMTPVWKGEPGETLLMEEHRFSMPFVSNEWQSDSKKRKGAALHSFPTPLAFGNQLDQWWTIGSVAADSGNELLMLSGPAAMNGGFSVVKAHQGREGREPMLLAYPDAYMNLEAGAIIEKTFFVEAYDVAYQGSGFMQPTQTSIELHQAHKLLEVFPSFETIVQKKYRYAQERWLEGDGYAGYNQFETGSAFIVWGWVGQAAAPGYAMQLLADEFGVSDDRSKVQKSLDFLSDSVFYDEGFYTWFNVEEQQWQIRIWRPMPEYLSQGQGMWNMANAINQGWKNGFDTSKWEAFLKKACEFYADRILSDSWDPKSTNEGFFISPLAKASELFDNAYYLKAAKKAAHYYADRHLDMIEPYWGGTLDASCEDKEGAFAAFQGFISMYEVTKDKTYLQWAEHAGMVCLTYLQVWDIDMPAGRLRDHDYKSRGWTTVSVQNHHLDVYGVLIAPDVYRLGKYTDNEVLEETAKLMFLSCGQLIDHRGSQGEQVQQTFYTQDLEDEGMEGAPTVYRGDYVEDWTVFWITAHFLNAAAQFKEMDVTF